MSDTHPRPLVFTHLHKCAGSSLRRMLHRLFVDRVPPERMHVPELTGPAETNLPMLEARGAPLPTDLLLLADHSPFGVYDARVLAPGTPFRVTLLREPLDRFESYVHFCARAGFVPDAWAAHAADLPRMPDDVLLALVERFDRESGAVAWLDPTGNDSAAAVANLRRFDVVARHDDLAGFGRMFDARNPYGLRFGTDVLHVNRTPRPSRLSGRQRRVVAERLAREVAFWESDEVQGAMRS